MKTLIDIPPSENELMMEAMSEDLETKIEKAIQLLKTFEPQALFHDENGYFLCNSGGKDSGAIYHLAKMAGVKFTNNHNLTTLDPPELIYFIRKNYPDIIIHKQKQNLLSRMVEKAQPPIRRIRWCCNEYKEQSGKNSIRVIGVRAEESIRRRGLWRQITLDKNNPRVFFVCPILFWTEKDVWDFHKKYNIPYCELYDKGRRRLGCIGCPLGGRKNMLEEFRLYPKYEQMWRKAFHKLWEKWKDVPTKKGKPRFFLKFKTPDKFFEWWLGENDKDEEMCQGSLLFSLSDLEENTDDENYE